MKMIILPLMILTLVCCKSSAQHHSLNKALIAEIDTMFKYDQFWRLESIKVHRKEKSAYSEDDIESNWAAADSLNEIKAKAIIAKYGYPGYDIAGKTSEHFWAIIQHCDDDIAFQDKVLVLMKKQVAANNANKQNYAYLMDRVLVNKNQKQIYGTQLQRDKVTGKFKPFPLKYPKTVNRLRKQIGLEPLENYIKSIEQ